MRSRPLINVQAIQPMLARLAALGCDAGALLSRVGLDAAVMNDPDARIPLELLDPLWTGAAELAKDDCFALHAAESVGNGSFGLISYLGVASPTWSDGLSRVHRFFRLFSDASNYELVIENDVATVFATHDVAPTGPVRQRIEFTVAALICYGRTNIEGGWVPTATFLEHASPACVAEHTRIFGVKPCFDAGASGFKFDVADLNRPLRSADPALLAVLESLALRQLPEHPAQASVAQALRASLTRCGMKIDGSLGEAARRLGMSARTLQRRLREEGTSHQQVLDEVRSGFAQQMLARAELGVTDVAYSLGFSDAAAFHRAFKRWTGRSPSEFRRALLLRHSRDTTLSPSPSVSHARSAPR